MSEQLEQVRKDYEDKLKRLALLEAGVDYTDVDKYVKYLKSDDDVDSQAQAIVNDINQEDNYGDPSQGTSWSPFRQSK